jgi:hypothetical protein
MHLVTLGILVMGVRRIMRFNILGCWLLVASTGLLSGISELIQQRDPFYRANGYALLLVLVLLFAWPLTAWRLRATAPPGAASST